MAAKKKSAKKSNPYDEADKAIIRRMIQPFIGVKKGEK